MKQTANSGLLVDEAWTTAMGFALRSCCHFPLHRTGAQLVAPNSQFAVSRM